MNHLGQGSSTTVVLDTTQFVLKHNAASTDLNVSEGEVSFSTRGTKRLRVSDDYTECTTNFSAPNLIDSSNPLGLTIETIPNPVVWDSVTSGNVDISQSIPGLLSKPSNESIAWAFSEQTINPSLYNYRIRFNLNSHNNKHRLYIGIGSKNIPRDDRNGSSYTGQYIDTFVSPAMGVSTSFMIAPQIFLYDSDIDAALIDSDATAPSIYTDNITSVPTAGAYFDLVIVDGKVSEFYYSGTDILPSFKNKKVHSVYVNNEQSFSYIVPDDECYITIMDTVDGNTGTSAWALDASILSVTPRESSLAQVVETSPAVFNETAITAQIFPSNRQSFIVNLGSIVHDGELGGRLDYLPNNTYFLPNAVYEGQLLTLRNVTSDVLTTYNADLSGTFILSPSTDTVLVGTADKNWTLRTMGTKYLLNSQLSGHEFINNSPTPLASFTLPQRETGRQIRWLLTMNVAIENKIKDDLLIAIDATKGSDSLYSYGAILRGDFTSGESYSLSHVFTSDGHNEILNVHALCLPVPPSEVDPVTFSAKVFSSTVTVAEL